MLFINYDLNSNHHQLEVNNFRRKRCYVVRLLINVVSWRFEQKPIQNIDFLRSTIYNYWHNIKSTWNILFSITPPPFLITTLSFPFNNTPHQKSVMFCRLSTTQKTLLFHNHLLQITAFFYPTILHHLPISFKIPLLNSNLKRKSKLNLRKQAKFARKNKKKNIVLMKDKVRKKEIF